MPAPPAPGLPALSEDCAHGSVPEYVPPAPPAQTADVVPGWPPPPPFRVKPSLVRPCPDEPAVSALPPAPPDRNPPARRQELLPSLSAPAPPPPPATSRSVPPEV